MGRGLSALPGSLAIGKNSGVAFCFDGSIDWENWCINISRWVGLNDWSNNQADNSNVATETRRKWKNRRKRAVSSAQPTTRWSQRDLPTACDRTMSPRGLEHASTACWTDKVGGGEAREVEDHQSLSRTPYGFYVPKFSTLYAQYGPSNLIMEKFNCHIWDHLINIYLRKTVNWPYISA